VFTVELFVELYFTILEKNLVGKPTKIYITKRYEYMLGKFDF